jgi:hypothetical protein
MKEKALTERLKMQREEIEKSSAEISETETKKMKIEEETTSTQNIDNQII